MVVRFIAAFVLALVIFITGFWMGLQTRPAAQPDQTDETVPVLDMQI